MRATASAHRAGAHAPRRSCAWPAALALAAWLVALAAAGAEGGAAASGWAVRDPGQGPVPLDSGSTGARELSGIAWAGGTRYLAVGDKGGMLFPLEIELDSASGAIRRAALAPGVHLAGAQDLEAVVVVPGGESVLTSDEVGPAIREHRVGDGSLLRSLPPPPIYTHARRNLSLESLSADARHTLLWTANEETLQVDGPSSSVAAGSLVRLQRLTWAGQPDGQWAYRTDAVPGAVRRGERTIESSGVSDLVALPDGGLLALERAFGPAGFRSRLYAVELTGATDVTSVAHLNGAGITPVGKRLLWERQFADYNFEGAALGPALDGGAQSLVLVSDSGHGFRQGLYALTVIPAGASDGRGARE